MYRRVTENGSMRFCVATALRRSAVLRGFDRIYQGVIGGKTVRFRQKKAPGPAAVPQGPDWICQGGNKNRTLRFRFKKKSRQSDVFKGYGGFGRECLPRNTSRHLDGFEGLD